MKANTIGAIILAAGNSSRLGRPKQLLEFQGVPLVRRTAIAAQSAGLHPVVIVTGSIHDEIASAIHNLHIETIRNRGWPTGIGSSIRVGLAHLLEHSPALHAVAILVCDQPWVTPEFLGKLSSAFLRSAKLACASSYSGTIGIPAIFGRDLFPELLTLPDAQGAKHLLQTGRAVVELVPFPHGEIDIDTPADWERLVRGDALDRAARS